MERVNNRVKIKLPVKSLRFILHFSFEKFCAMLTIYFIFELSQVE